MKIKPYTALPPLVGEYGEQLHMIRRPDEVQPSVALLLIDENQAAELTLSLDEATQLRNTLFSFLEGGKNRHSRNSDVKRLTLEDEAGVGLEVYYDNRGEPYRQGLTFRVVMANDADVSAFFEDSVLPELLDFLESCVSRNNQEPSNA